MNKQNQKSESSTNQNIIVQDLYAVMALAGAAIIASLIPDFHKFYFDHFIAIWLSAVIAAIALITLSIKFYLKKTKSVEEQGKIFEHAWKPEGFGSILAGYVEGEKIYVPEKARLGHVQVLGTTGRGKTESVILPWMMRDASRGISSVLIDGKGEPEIVSKIRSTLGDRVKLTVFDLGNLSNSCEINPLASGSPQQITDRIFASFDFDDTYYRAVQFEAALTIVELLSAIGEVVTFKRIYELLSNDAAVSVAVQHFWVSLALTDRIGRMLGMPRRDRDEKFAGLMSQLAPFAVGEVSAIVNSTKRNESAHQTLGHMALTSTIRFKAEIFVLLIPTLKYQAIGKQLGKMVLQELAWAIGERASRSGANWDFLPVYLDEFSAFAYEGFEQILNKARSSNVALHLSHQSMADLSIVSQDFARIVSTNTNVKCLFGLNDPDTADFFARHIGTESTERKTERVEVGGLFQRDQRTGQGSVREVEEYKIHPNRLKNFTNGYGVLHFPTAHGNLTTEIQFERILENAEAVKCNR